ncbi:MAG: hypothetical protein KIS91_04055 [Anaerolineae bacterium]|nr:hypothetical protein [Anaerolineae bacterium]
MRSELPGSFSRDNLNKLAQQVGLDMTQFGQCVRTVTSIATSYWRR